MHACVGPRYGKIFMRCGGMGGGGWGMVTRYERELVGLVGRGKGVRGKGREEGREEGNGMGGKDVSCESGER